jgi:hypothetical protein
VEKLEKAAALKLLRRRCAICCDSPRAWTRATAKEEAFLCFWLDSSAPLSDSKS